MKLRQDILDKTNFHNSIKKKDLMIQLKMNYKTVLILNSNSNILQKMNKWIIKHLFRRWLIILNRIINNNYQVIQMNTSFKPIVEDNYLMKHISKTLIFTQILSMNKLSFHRHNNNLNKRLVNVCWKREILEIKIIVPSLNKIHFINGMKS